MDISGVINGVTFDFPVSGGGVGQGDGVYNFDNAIFTDTSGTTGIGGGTVDGIDNYGLVFTVNGVEYNLYDNGGSLALLAAVPGQGYTENTNVTNPTTNAPCFCAGTMISTASGEIAVEALAIGDTVTTVDGTQKTIRWIGRRAVATRFADPLTAMPIRIQAGALADSMPVRDSLMSPCHAVLVDGILAQAGALVNGTSIVREMAMPETFTYYHIELEDHALIVADGIASETFVDNTDRMGFDNWEEHCAMFGKSVEIVEMAYPRAKSARQVPASIRARLAARASAPVAVAA